MEYKLIYSTLKSLKRLVFGSLGRTLIALKINYILVNSIVVIKGLTFSSS